jgi:ribosomal protein S12 methylthiotransferase
MEIQEAISMSANLAKVGQSVKVLIDRADDEFLIGRTEFDSPEVDNEVLIRKGESAPAPGTFCKVRITHAESFDLFGDLE